MTEPSEIVIHFDRFLDFLWIRHRLVYLNYKAI